MSTTPVKRGRGRPSNASRAALAQVPASTLNVTARYDAAGMGRRMRSWSPPMTGPNKAMQGIDRLRSRARDTARNDWSGESSIQHWTTNLIGVGILTREKAAVPTTRKQARAALWTRWAKVCDADGVLDLYGQQTLGVRSWLDGGEYFIRRRPRRSDSPLEVPLQVQLLESEFCPTFDADQFLYMPQGNRIRSGIELDRSGQRVAYWFYKEHPGDTGQFFTPSPEQLLRVSASDVSHVFEPKRIGQLRGVSHLAPVLARLRNMVDYDDAVLERQKLANLFMAFIKRELPEGLDVNIDPGTGLPYMTDPETGAALQPMEPGLMAELAPGEEMQFTNPPEAGTTYSDYMRTQNLATSAGAGLPYEIFSGDIINVSDRTLRIVINEFRRLCEQRQWQIVIPMHCQKIREWFVDAAALAGLIPLSQVNEAKDVTHVPHGWQYIHPVQDAEGKALEVKSGVRSRSSWITERGDDPEQVDAERKVDIDREKELGVPVVETAEADKAAAGQKQQQDAAAARQGLEARMVDESVILMRAQATQASAPQQPMTITVSAPIVNVAPPQITVDNHVEPTPVTVAAPNVTVEAPVVTVEPARVEVTNRMDAPQVHVSPTPVEIVNNIEAKAGETKVVVDLPRRQIDSTITRDAKGAIETVKQIEKTIE